MKLVLIIALVLTLGAFVFHQPGGQQRTDRDSTITPAALYSRMQQGDTSIVILDVRTPEEFAGATGHLAGARLLPLYELSQRIRELDKLRNRTIVSYCRSGHRSGVATEMLQAQGFRALNMIGGIIRWHQEQLPVVREGAR